MVALMQYTADEQDSCSTLAPEAQPRRGNGSENGWRHAVSNFTCCIYPQPQATVIFTLYDWHPDEFSDVLRLIRPTIYKQDFERFLRLQ